MSLYAEKNFIENIRNYSYDRQSFIPPILKSFDNNNNNNNNNQQDTPSMLMRIFYTLFPFLKPTICPVMLEYEEESESDNESKCETNDDENNLTSFERYMFIKFGLTYHLNQNLTPVSSRGTLEDLENDEFEDYINEKYSRSVSSPY